jgi:hypothetical protein
LLKPEKILPVSKPEKIRTVAITRENPHSCQNQRSSPLSKPEKIRTVAKTRENAAFGKARENQARCKNQRKPGKLPKSEKI